MCQQEYMSSLSEFLQTFCKVYIHSIHFIPVLLTCYRMNFEHLTH